MFDSLTNSSNMKLDSKEMKAYPSVYSANNGNMHTEETVRWITKKISSKSFIAATDKDRFNVICDVLPESDSNGRCIGITPVSMSIDGYQIKKGDSAEVSFDVYSEKPMALNIVNQCEFVQELSYQIETDLDQIVFDAYKSSTPDYLINWNSLYEDTIIGRIKISYSDQSFINQITYKYPYIYYDENNKIVVYNSVPQFETTTPFAIITGSPITNIDIYYPVMYGHKNFLTENLTKLNNNPVITFTDIFGFNFIRSVSVGMTKSYPSAHSFTDNDTNCAGSFSLFNNPKSASQFISDLTGFQNGDLISAPSNLYDFTTYYTDDSRTNNDIPLTTITFNHNALLGENALFNYLDNYNNNIPSGVVIKTNLGCYTIKEITSNLQTVGTNSIPVCFMTSDGNLCPTGLPRFENDSDTAVVKGNYPVEGYIHYLNRMYLTKYVFSENITEDDINSVTLADLIAWQRDDTALDSSSFYRYFEPIEKCISLYIQMGYSKMLENLNGSGQTKKELRYCGSEVSVINNAHSDNPNIYYELNGLVTAYNSNISESVPYTQRFMVNNTSDYEKISQKMIVSSKKLISDQFNISDVQDYYKKAFTMNTIVSGNYASYIDDPINYFRKCAKSTSEENTLTMKLYKAVNNSGINVTEVSINCDPYVADGGSVIENVSVTPLLIPYTDNIVEKETMTEHPYVDVALRISIPSDICMTYINNDSLITGCSGIAFEYDYETWSCELPLIAYDNVNAHRYLIGDQYDMSTSTHSYGGITFTFDTWKNILPRREKSLLFGVVRIGTDYTNADCNVETPDVSYDLTDLKNSVQRNSIIHVENIYADVDVSLCEYIVNVIRNSLDFIVYTGQCGDDAFYSVYSSGLIRVFGTGAMWDYNPLSAGVHTQNPFKNFTQFNRLIVEDGITKVGDRSFRRCYKLGRVELSNTITEIGFDAFVADSNYFTAKGSLTVANIPSSCTTIAQSAFSNTALEFLYVPDTVTTIGSYAFSQCSNLTDVVYDAETISDMCFTRCTSLRNMTILSNLTSIGKSCFMYCTSLEEITYNRTKASWNSITKGEGWDGKITSFNQEPPLPVPASESALHIIHCTDGDIEYTNGSWQ